MSISEKNYEGENTELIKSFVNTLDLQENYEVWSPYSHRGMTGFIDLVLRNQPETSVYKFLKNGRKIKQAVKKLKLETTLFKQSEGISDDNLSSCLVINDNKRNRKAVLYQYGLLANQPFDILFLNRTKGKIESVSELKENIPRLFQTEKIQLEKEALRKLISRPDHEEIERAILNLENPPDVITGSLVEKIDRFLKNNEKMPEKIVVSQEKYEDRSYDTYKVI